MNSIPRKARCATHVVVMTLAFGVFPVWAQEEASEQGQEEPQEASRQSQEPQENPPQQAQEPPPESPPQLQEPPEEEPHILYWDQGLNFGWKQLSLKIAGAVQNDSAAFANVSDELVDQVGPITDGVEWRRARVSAEGRFYDRIEWKFQYDFAVSNPPQLKDAYLGVRLPNFGLGEIRFRGGRFKAPLSLEGNTSAVNTTFMERGVVAAFFPSRNTGFLLQGVTDRFRHKIHWNIGAIQPEDELGSTDTDNLGVAGRFTYAFEPGTANDTTIHTGIDFTRRNVSDTISYLSRPESHIAPSFVHTGDIAANAANAGNLETGFIKGPLSLQGELAWARVSASNDLPDPDFYAFYVYTSYFLTGERRPYEVERGAFGQIVPNSPFTGTGGGTGAFEIAFRFSRIDLNDEKVDGGEMSDVTGAFNWYASRNARVLANVIWSKVEGFDPVWIFQARLQWAY